MLLQVIVCTTRPGRVSRSVADWFAGYARDEGTFEVELVDLAEVALPLFDEPRHPRLGRYEHEHTRRWSSIVDRADAFVFVTPEYNHGPTAALVNALDFVSREWAYKPASFVSYGGISGGLRGVELTKPILTGLKMMPIPEEVAVPSYPQYLDERSGRFVPGQVQQQAAGTMLGELARWAQALRPLRAG